MKKVFQHTLAGVAVAALVATPAMAKKASQLTSINGATGANAERALQSEGFSFVSSHKNTMGYVYSYWWDSRDKDCVQVEVYNGRVETIQDAKGKDCGHSGGGEAAAVGIAAGALILGALLTSKSHHKEDKEYDETQTAEFDRGYRDGLHGAPYYNDSRSDAYSHGYTQGNDEREANLRDHPRRGGYVEQARIDDLRGARAAGGMDELDRRGFRQVDNFTSGNARYSIQWRSSSRQCVQVTIADGKFEDIRDIGTHPKCSGR